MLLQEAVINDIIGLLELKINLTIYIGANLRRPWPVIGTMSSDKDVILLLLFICCSHDVIVVALEANGSFEFHL